MDYDTACVLAAITSKRNHSPCSDHEHQSPLQNDEAIMFENFDDDDHPNSSFEEHTDTDNYGSVNDGVGLILAASLAEGNPNDSSNWQVVPESLDRLSRDELCQMICRLDYERNELRDLLRQQQQFQQQQQLMMQQDNCEHWNQLKSRDVPTTTTPLIRAVSDFIGKNRHQCEQKQQYRQPNKKSSSRPARKRKQQHQNEPAQEGDRALQASLEGDADDCNDNESIDGTKMCNYDTLNKVFFYSNSKPPPSFLSYRNNDS
jgi:hypothetical protein